MLKELTREISLGKVDPYGVISRGLTNHCGPIIHKSLLERLNHQRLSYEENRAHRYVEIYDSLLAQARGSGFQEGWRLLEVGLGPGLLAKSFAEKELQVFGIDIVDTRITFSDTHFTQARGQCLPFPNGIFNCVSLTSLLHHLPKKEHSLLVAETVRVLDREGYLFVQEDIRANDWWQQAFVRGIDHLVSCPEANSHRRSEEWCQFFRKCGLKILATGIINPGFSVFRVKKQFFVLQPTPEVKQV